MGGFPKFPTTQELPDVPYHRFAELLGFKGIAVDDPEKMGAAWEEALASDRPVLIDVRTDPEIPPLPPHIKFEQAKKFMNTIQQGDPDQAEMVKGVLSQVLAPLGLGHKE